MRAAVISDVHSNLSALEAVLGAIEGAGIAEVWCLGDLVGYGAEPNACVELVRERCAFCLVGNHDLAVLGLLDIGAFSATAAEAVRWTQASVSERTLEFLRTLKPAGSREEIGLFHASPRDPVWEYVLSVEQADACLDLQTERVCLIGHSHVSLFFDRPAAEVPGGTRGGQSVDAAQFDLSAGAWLLNPGSVGQPRDEDPRAAWIELDCDQQFARFHRVGYDIDRAAQAIISAGLPEHLAERLYAGT